MSCIVAFTTRKIYPHPIQLLLLSLEFGLGVSPTWHMFLTPRFFALGSFSSGESWLSRKVLHQVFGTVFCEERKGMVATEWNQHYWSPSAMTPRSLAPFIACETAADASLGHILQLIEKGNTRFDNNDPALVPLWPACESFYVHDGVLLYQDKIVVPYSLHNYILQHLHATHQGTSMIYHLLARDVAGHSWDERDVVTATGMLHRKMPHLHSYLLRHQHRLRQSSQISLTMVDATTS